MNDGSPIMLQPTFECLHFGNGLADQSDDLDEAGAFVVLPPQDWGLGGNAPSISEVLGVVCFRQNYKNFIFAGNIMTERIHAYFGQKIERSRFLMARSEQAMASYNHRSFAL